MKNTDQLTVLLVERVMGWSAGPDRFMMAGRQWLPRWRFQPDRRLADAFRLLEEAAPKEYAMGAAEHAGFWARVKIEGVTGEALESSQARALTFAIARAIGIDPEGKG